MNSPQLFGFQESVQSPFDCITPTMRIYPLLLLPLLLQLHTKQFIWVMPLFLGFRAAFTSIDWTGNTLHLTKTTTTGNDITIQTYSLLFFIRSAKIRLFKDLDTSHVAWLWLFMRIINLTYENPAYLLALTMMLFTDFKQRLEFSCIFRENVISLADTPWSYLWKRYIPFTMKFSKSGVDIPFFGL